MSSLKTYYSHRLGSTVSWPDLEGEIEAEICVVGGGLAGLTTALELARAGRSVAVVEAEHIGFGASGRNGGFVGPAWSQRLDSLARRVGDAHARELYQLSREGVGIVAGNITELGMPGIDLKRGKLSAARTPSGEAFARRCDRLQRDFGQRVDVWETDRVREALRTPRYFQALFYPDDFQINPLAYTRGLAAEIERLGGQIFEHSRVKKLERAVGKRIVRTARGRISAEQIVIACGGYTERWATPLFRSYVPIATYVMLTDSQPELIATAVRTSYAVGDQRRAGDYYRLVDDGTRILWGGRITTQVSEPLRLAEMLHASMVSTFPQLKGLRVDYAWSGLMSYARHLMPQIAPIEDGLWSCTAFGGHGLNTTAIGGKILAEAILGNSDRWRLFVPFGFDWNGATAGRIAVQATYWWLQARDFVGEALSRAGDTGA